MFVHLIVGEEEIPIKPLYLILMKNNLGNIKECRTLIKHGCVKVNDWIIKDIHYQVQRKDKIEVDGKIMKSFPFYYYMLNKPKGYICANHDAVYPCVIDLIDRQDCFCVGRLDLDTTGFVFITNDKSVTQRLTHPRFHIEKTYEVETLKPLSLSDVKRFHEGIMIDKDCKCLPAELKIIDDYHCYVTLYEGKYHQIKKMFLSCHNQVIALKRISFMGILLDETLGEGQYRAFNEEEFQKMKELCYDDC